MAAHRYLSHHLSTAFTAHVRKIYRQRGLDLAHSNGPLADLARARERHLTTARAEQVPKYGQIRTESRLFRTPFSGHLTFPCCC